MGKGDKKTKRGKIIIGSSGVSRAKKKRNTTPSAGVKSEPKPISTEIEAESPAKKTTKKDEVAEVTDDKAKSSKAKKAADELPLEETK
jgi:30S ribosomal protein S31